ncbi:MAG: glycosyltransferase [Gemmataceae bacterium]|nr:glycosyltransferase [Gemmataceae bacterium]
MPIDTLSSGMGASESAPLVTAAVICYNHAKWAMECLESVTCQSYSSIEIVIIDDFSQDNSVEVIEKWLAIHPQNCKFIKHSKNEGVCRSFNDALANANGKYFAPIAADDVWLPEKIKVQVEIMEKLASDVALVYSDAYLIDESGSELPGKFIETYKGEVSQPFEGWVFDELFRGNFIQGQASLIRRECLDAAGGYDETLRFEDWDMWLRLSKRYRVVFSSYASVKYRICNSSLLRTRGREISVSCDDMFIKLLRLGWLNTQQREDALYRMARRGFLAYECREPGHLRMLAELLRYRPRLRTGVALLFAALGVPFGYYSRLVVLCLGAKAVFAGLWKKAT